MIILAESDKTIAETRQYVIGNSMITMIFAIAARAITAAARYAAGACAAR